MSGAYTPDLEQLRQRAARSLPPGEAAGAGWLEVLLRLEAPTRAALLRELWPNPGRTLKENEAAFARLVAAFLGASALSEWRLRHIAGLAGLPCEEEGDPLAPWLEALALSAAESDQLPALVVGVAAALHEPTDALRASEIARIWQNHRDAQEERLRQQLELEVQLLLRRPEMAPQVIFSGTFQGVNIAVGDHARQEVGSAEPLLPQDPLARKRKARDLLQEAEGLAAGEWPSSWLRAMAIAALVHADLKEGAEEEGLRGEAERAFAQAQDRLRSLRRRTLGWMLRLSLLLSTLGVRIEVAGAAASALMVWMSRLLRPVVVGWALSLGIGVGLWIRGSSEEGMEVDSKP